LRNSQFLENSLDTVESHVWLISILLKMACSFSSFFFYSETVPFGQDFVAPCKKRYRVPP